MRTTFLALLACGLLAAAFAVPAAGGAQFTTFQVTLMSAGDPDGTGTAVLDTDAKDEAVCYQIHTPRT